MARAQPRVEFGSLPRDPDRDAALVEVRDAEHPPLRDVRRVAGVALARRGGCVRARRAEQRADLGVAPDAHGALAGG